MSKAQGERLALLVEECAEVIQCCTKIIRFGADGHHPNRPEETNMQALERELGGLSAVIVLMTRKNDLSELAIDRAHFKKAPQLLTYTRHQQEKE